MKQTGQNRRQFLRTTYAVGAGVLTANWRSSNAQTIARKPNVILVMTDDQGYGDVHCLGNRIIKTPTMDKLYTQSTRLRDFHVGPTCSPTRASLMTGHYCNRTGVWHTIMGRSLLRRDEVTMADVFSANGYRTAIFGKWHLGDNYPFRPQERGFQEVLIHGGGGVGQTPDFWGNNYFDDTYWHNGVPHKYKGYCTDIWFDEALRFIEKNRHQPFFVYLPTNAAHAPFRVSQRYIDMYKDNPEVPLAAFYGMITNIDDNLARLLQTLKRLNLEDNTILVFMTDNGTSAGMRNGKGFNAGMRGIKGSEYDGGHRVPCFIRWPKGGIKPGRDVNHLTAHVDLLPTFIDLCKLKKPAGVKFDGKSIAPLLFNDGTDWPERVLITDSQRIEHPEKWRKSAVMTDRWRLINGKELYEIHADPGQKNDVAERYPNVVERLRGEYEKWWADVSRRFDEYCEIVLGSKYENPSRLTCHDWHAHNVPWDQGLIRRDIITNGFWAVETDQPARYEFTLRRRPLGVAHPIAAVKAKIKILDITKTRNITPQSEYTRFRLDLPKGKTRLQTWLTDEKGRTCGAYYVYVKRL